MSEPQALLPKDDSLASLDDNKMTNSRIRVGGKLECRYASQLHSFVHTPLPEIVKNKRYGNQDHLDMHEIQPIRSKGRHKSRASMPDAVVSGVSGTVNSSEVVLYKAMGESDGQMGSTAESFPADLTFKIEDFHEAFPSK